MKNIILKLIIILLIIILISSSFYIVKELYNNQNEENEFKKLSQIVEENNLKSESKESKYQELYLKNKDFIGWLKIDGTNIDYPVMQTKDRPNFYLRKNFYKEYSAYGIPYISEICDINTSDNIIIYGHNIQLGSMFSDLLKYKSYEFYKNHKYIQFNTLDVEYVYKVVCCFKTTVYNKNSFKYYEYSSFSNEKEFNTFFYECNKLSFFDINESVNYGDKLLTLSTCEYSNKNGRMVIVAKRI